MAAKGKIKKRGGKRNLLTGKENLISPEGGGALKMILLHYENPFADAKTFL